MAIVHSYDLTANSGQEEALEAALRALGEAVKSITGSHGTMVLQDSKEPQRFLFLEFWQDEASRKAAGAQLPKDVMSRLMAAVAGNPIKMADYERLGWLTWRGELTDWRIQ